LPAKSKAHEAQKTQDPAAEATAVHKAPANRPEQHLTSHDQSEDFDWHRPALTGLQGAAQGGADQRL